MSCCVVYLCAAGSAQLKRKKPRPGAPVNVATNDEYQNDIESLKKACSVKSPREQKHTHARQKLIRQHDISIHLRLNHVDHVELMKKISSTEVNRPPPPPTQKNATKTKKASHSAYN